MTLYVKQRRVGGLSLYRADYGEGILMHTRPFEGEDEPESKTIWADRFVALQIAEMAVHGATYAWDAKPLSWDERSTIGEILADIGIRPDIAEGEYELDIGYGKFKKGDTWQYPLHPNAYYKIQHFIDEYIEMRQGEEWYELVREIRE